jgi:hypothetical protein
MATVMFMQERGLPLQAGPATPIHQGDSRETNAGQASGESPSGARKSRHPCRKSQYPKPSSQALMTEQNIKEISHASAKACSIDDALKQLKHLPFEDVGLPASTIITPPAGFS